MKVKKKFYYDEIELSIVETQEIYMNSNIEVTVTLVIAPNGGIVPVKIGNKQSLKSIVNETVAFLDNFKNMGYDVKKQLTETKKWHMEYSHMTTMSTVYIMVHLLK